MLTYERAAELLAYDPETGKLTWKKALSNRAPAGSAVRTKAPRGYIRAKIDGKNYMAHRLAWLLVYREWPAGAVDHANGVRDDNRLCNLRSATNAENQYNAPAHRNSSTGVKNVTWNASSGRWMARVQAGGKNRYIGRFDNIEDAAAAARAAREELHGAFARH